MGQVGPAEVLLGLYVVWALAAVVICVLKRKFIMAIISLVIGGGIIQTIGAARLAKPQSWWANRFYDEAKAQRSRERYFK